MWIAEVPCLFRFVLVGEIRRDFVGGSYNIHNYMKKHNAQYKNNYINSHSAKQNWKNKKNCCSYHSSSKRGLRPFWFHLLTIVSSFIGTEILSQATRCVPHCENQNHGCHTDSRQTNVTPDRIHIVRKRPTLKNHIDSYISICQTRSSR